MYTSVAHVQSAVSRFCSVGEVLAATLCLVLVQESKPGLANVEPKRKRGPGYRRCRRRRSRRGWPLFSILVARVFFDGRL